MVVLLLGGSPGVVAMTRSYTTVSDFASGLKENGNLVITRTGDGELELSRRGFLKSWTSTASLNSGRLGAAVVAAGNHLYVIGGWNGDYLNSVEIAAIQPDGTLSSWLYTSPLTVKRSFHAAVVADGYLYVLGGSDSTGTLSSIERAAMRGDGSLAPWTTLSSRLTTARQGSAVVVVEGRIYIIGGSDSAMSLGLARDLVTTDPSLLGEDEPQRVGTAAISVLSSVEWATINADGSLGSWASTSPLAMGRVFTAGVVASDVNGYKYIYVLGGWNNGYLATVERAWVRDDGTLESWSATASLRMKRGYHAAVVANGYIYALGGYDGTHLSAVERATLNADGTLGGWMTSAALSTARRGLGGVAVDGRLYTLGGYDGNSVLGSVELAVVKSEGSLGGWFSATSLGTARYGAAAVVVNDRIYVLGGFDTDWNVLSSVEMSVLNADGTLGPWTTTTALITPTAQLSAVAWNGYIYAIGGWNNTDGYLGIVQRATVNQDGTLGNWTAVSALNTKRAQHAAVVTNGRLYVSGGYNASDGVLSSLERATLNFDNTVSAWTPLPTSLNTPRYSHALVVAGGNIYAIGGYRGDAYLKSVERATVDLRSGDLSPWQTESSLQLARSGVAAVAHGHFLYALGGAIGPEDRKDPGVERVTVKPDGRLGDWQIISSLSTARSGAAAVVANGYIYVFAGHTGTKPLASVEGAALTTDGSLEGWGRASDMVRARYGHGTVATSTWLYSVGGDDGNNALSSVERAPINSDGSLGPWQETSPLAYAHSGAAVAMATVITGTTTAKYIYAIGGRDGQRYYDRVEGAVIAVDGSLGTWQEGPHLTRPRYEATAVVMGNYLYVLGGYDQEGNVLNSVERAAIKTDGTLSSWGLVSSSMRTPRYGAAAVVADGFLYVFGGKDGTGLSGSVERAWIGPDGGLGTWQVVSILNVPRYRSAAAYLNGFLYVLGGDGGGPLSSVEWARPNTDGSVSSWNFTSLLLVGRKGLSATVSGGNIYVSGGQDGGVVLKSVERTGASALLPPGGSYTGHADFAVDVSIDSLSWDGTANDGLIEVRYRTAPNSTARYGEWTPYSTITPVSVGVNARYLEYQLRLRRAGDLAVPPLVREVRLEASALPATPTWVYKAYFPLVMKGYVSGW